MDTVSIIKVIEKEKGVVAKLSRCRHKIICSTEKHKNPKKCLRKINPGQD